MNGGTCTFSNSTFPLMRLFSSSRPRNRFSLWLRNFFIITIFKVKPVNYYFVSSRTRIQDERDHKLKTTFKTVVWELNKTIYLWGTVFMNDWTLVHVIKLVTYFTSFVLGKNVISRHLCTRHLFDTQMEYHIHMKANTWERYNCKLITNVKPGTAKISKEETIMGTTASTRP